MTKYEWSWVTVPDEVAWKRASGRRRYNSIRKMLKELRQWRVASLYCDASKDKIVRLMKTPLSAYYPSPKPYCIIIRLAEHFGVSRQTIHRDLNAVWWPNGRKY